MSRAAALFAAYPMRAVTNTKNDVRRTVVRS